jgi:hypothetical protein
MRSLVATAALFLTVLTLGAAQPAAADGHLAQQGGQPFKKGSIIVNVANEKRVRLGDVMAALQTGADTNVRYAKTGGYIPPDDDLELKTARMQDAQRSKQYGRTVTSAVDEAMAKYKGFAQFKDLAPGTYVLKVGKPGAKTWSAPVQITITDVEPAWSIAVTMNSKTKKIKTTVTSFGKASAGR